MNVENQGTEPETFDVSVFYGSTLIETRSDMSLVAGANTTAPFNWTTSEEGTFTIKAEVPPVAGETDTVDNVFIDGTVKVNPIPVHDIAVTNVVPSPTEVTAGDSVNINVAVKNEGNVQESFTLNVYAGAELVGSTTPTLSTGANETYLFAWTTTAEGSFLIKAEVPPVTGEIDTADNVFTDGNVTVSPQLFPPVASFTHSPENPYVDDLVTFTSTSTDADGYIVSWEWDLNGDGVIDATTENTTWTYTTAGDYNVTLTVTDNDGLNDTTWDIIKVLSPSEVHDIAVTAVYASPTEAYTSYGSVNINVTVKNEGNMPETFNVSIYYNLTLIETRTDVYLPPGANTTLAFTWNVAGDVPLGYYVISAAAEQVLGETDTGDNSLNDGTVQVKKPGDITGDGKVDGFDLGWLGKAWGSKVGEPDYDERADFNGDGRIDGFDLGIMGLSWGK